MTLREELARIVAERDVFERELRIRIWNECKTRGDMDGMAIHTVKETIAALKARAASGIEAGTDETQSGSARSARARPDAQTQGE